MPSSEIRLRLVQNASTEARKMTTEFKATQTATQRLARDYDRLTSAKARAQIAARDYGGALQTVRLRVVAAEKGTVQYYRALTQQAQIERQATQATLTRARASDTASSAIGRQSTALTGLAGSLRGAVLAGGGLAILQKGMDFARQSAQIDGVRDSFMNLARSSGVDAGTLLGNIRTASQGTIKEFDAMRSSNMAMLSQIQGFTMALPQLAEIAKVSAVAMGRDVTEGYNRLIEGISKAEPEILDEMGIRINLTRLYDQAATALGKNVDQLSQNEKAQILLNEVLRQGSDLVRQIGTDAGDSVGKFALLETGAYNLGNAIINGVGNAIIVVSGLWKEFYQGIGLLESGSSILSRGMGTGAVKGVTKPLAVVKETKQKQAQDDLTEDAYKRKQREQARTKPTVSVKDVVAAQEAERQYRYETGSTVEKLAQKRAELAKVRQGSAEYYRILTDVKQLEQQLAAEQQRASKASVTASNKAASAAEKASTVRERAAAESVRAAEEVARTEEQVFKAKIDLLEEEGRLTEVLALLRERLAGTSDEERQLQLQKEILQTQEKISDEEERRYKAALDLRRLSVEDRKSRLDELKDLEQAARIIRSSASDAGMKARARLRIEEIRAEQDTRAYDIAQTARDAGGVVGPLPSVGGSPVASITGLPLAGVPAGAPAGPGGTGDMPLPGMRVVEEIHLYVDGEEISAHIVKRLRAGRAAAASAGVVRRGY